MHKIGFIYGKFHFFINSYYIKNNEKQLNFFVAFPRLPLLTKVREKRIDYLLVVVVVAVGGVDNVGNSKKLDSVRLFR